MDNLAGGIAPNGDDPFRRSSRMSRSPTRGVETMVKGAGIPALGVVRAQTDPHPTAAIPCNRGAVEATNSASAASTSAGQKKLADLISVPTQKIASKSPSGSPIRPLDLLGLENEGLRSILALMSAKINMVLSAFETQRHVTKETKGAISDLAALSSRAIQLEGGLPKEGSFRESGTQTERQTKLDRPSATSAKRKLLKDPSVKPPVVKVSAEKPSLNKSSKRETPTPKEPKEPNTLSYAAVAKVASKEEWSRVKPKRLRKKPEALILKKTGEASYADMLRKLRADPNLNDFGKHVKKIRRTQQGELLLEVEGKAADSVPKFRGAIEDSLKEMAAVRTGAQKMALSISGMDEATTAEELLGCLASQFQGIVVNPDAVRGLRKMRDGTQIATVMLSINDAITVLKAGTVTVGWSRCRIIQDVRPTRCYRCLCYGHRASSCKATDRSDCCLRCGERGHKAKGCHASPKCMICSSEVDRNHTTGGFACPTFKASLKGAKSHNNV
jgi:hypothetical protein